MLHIDFEKFASCVGRVAEVAFFDDLRVEGHRLVEGAEVCDTNLDQRVDLDGDGKTSLFTITAELDAASRLRVDRRVNESDPHE